MAQTLLTHADLAVYLRRTVEQAEATAACDAAYALVCNELNVDVETADWPPGYRTDAIIVVMTRVAARIYDNPLDASNVTVESGRGAWSANTIAGPRVLTDDEKRVLNRWRRGRSGVI